MREWAVLGVLVQDSGPWTFYTTLPEGFADLAEKLRLQLLVDCQTAANLSPSAAAAIFAQLSRGAGRVATPPCGRFS